MDIEQAAEIVAEIGVMFIKPEFPAELDRIYKITDGVIRSIIIKKDPRFANAAAKPRKAAEPKPIDVEAVAAEAVDAKEESAAE